MKKRCFNVPASPLNQSVCVKPTIVTHPQGQNLDQGESVTLTVLASGSDPKTYQWYKGDLQMPGETSDELELLYLDLVDAGTYKVRVSNACGQVFSNNAVVVVNDIGAPSCVPVTILTHPQGKVFAHGDNHTMTVEVGGTAPFTYQWMKGDDELPGETGPELEFIYLQEAEHQGSYWVKVENECGEINSANAMLIIENDGNDGGNDPDPGDGGDSVFIDDSI